MTTKEIVLVFLIWWGAQLVASSLLWLKVLGGGSNTNWGVVPFAVGIGLLGASIVVWKKWEE
jgi:hypothetical protein